MQVRQTPAKGVRELASPKGVDSVTERVKVTDSGTRESVTHGVESVTQKVVGTGNGEREKASPKGRRAPRCDERESVSRRRWRAPKLVRDYHEGYEMSGCMLVSPPPPKVKRPPNYNRHSQTRTPDYVRA